MKFIFKLSALSLIVASSIASLSVQNAHAQDLDSNEKSLADGLTLSVNTWISEGKTTERFTSGNPILGSPTSVLVYDDLDSTVVEFGGRYQFTDRIFGHASYGFGDIDNGNLVDQDFLSPQGAQQFGINSNDDFLFSQTTSQVDDDDLSIFTIGGGFTLINTGRSQLDLIGQYQRWEEDYTAKGVRFDTCSVGALGCNGISPGQTLPQFDGVEVIRNDVEWDSVGVGLSGKHFLTDKFNVSGKAIFNLADLEADDTHLLREDLAQNPSFRSEGDAEGFTLEIGANYSFLPNLNAGVGYRYMELEVDNESNGIRSFGADGTVGTGDLDKFESKRDGVFFNLEYEF